MGEIGVDLATYTVDLTKVRAKHDSHPARSFNVAKILGPKVIAYMKAYGETGNIEKEGYVLPSEVFTRFDDAQKAMLFSSMDGGLHDSVDKEIDADATQSLIQKIRTSIWNTSLERAGWNETVDAYDGIRSFSLGIEGFTVTLDHTVWRLRQGKSKYAKVFLDGVFGFLVHYRGKHVMTIGFSIARGRKLLLEQVQNCSQTGNRWLYKMPANRMELVVDRLRAAFPKHEIYVADGASVADKNLTAYRNGYETAARWISRYQEQLKLDPANDNLPGEIAEQEQWCRTYEEKIARVEADKPRLISFYGNLGKYRLAAESLRSNGLVLRAIAI